jgi:acetyl esterase/lipase
VSGLPPTYVSVGSFDLFLEENMTYADCLSRAGVPVEFHMYPRTYHGFYHATNAHVTALMRTPILSAMWNDMGQRIQRAANLQIRIEAQFAPEPFFAGPSRFVASPECSRAIAEHS